MTDPVRAKIESELDETCWDALAVHAKREALFVVDANLPLADVAHAAATNRATLIAFWLEAGLLARPDADAHAAWDAAPLEHRFRVVITQPFVFVQRLASAPDGA